MLVTKRTYTQYSCWKTQICIADLQTEWKWFEWVDDRFIIQIKERQSIGDEKKKKIV